MILKKLNLILSLAAISAVALTTNAQYRLPGQHSAEHQDLIAGQISTESQMSVDLSAYNIFGEEEEPEMDIYEGGWDSGLVNCYKETDVPQTAVITLGDFAMPCPGYVTSPYGYRKRWRRQHKGVDLKVHIGDTIFAAFDGRVRITNYEGKGYGNYIVIRHGNELETVYGHLSAFLVEPDQYVKCGQPIALGGNTGRSTGPHLHFETRFMGYPINPAAIFDFANQTAHTDTYTFDKRTYQQARDFSPAANSDYQKEYAAARAAGLIKGQGTPEDEQKYARVGRRHKGSTATASASGGTQYKIRNGDTLSKIARANGTTVQKLCSLNGISTRTVLRVGSTIRVR